MTKGKKVNVLEGDVDSTLRKLAAPLALAFVLNILNGWVDKIYVSRLGDIELASMGVSDQIRLLIFTLGIGFAVGTGVVVARRIGEGKKEEANQVATQALVTMFLYSVVIASICFYFLNDLLSLLGYTGELKTNSIIYL